MFSVAVEIVKPGMKLAEAVYNRERVKLLNRGTVLDSALIERMQRAGVDAVWISADHETGDPGSGNYQVPENPSMSKAAMRVYNGLVRQLEEIRNKALTVADFDMYYVNKLIEKTVGQVLNRYRLYTEIVRLRKKSPSVLEHMADVCLISAATGKIIGMSQHDIRILATAALLHDIGKFFIPDSILNKPGRLSESDQFLVMKHTIMGHDLLTGIKGVNRHIITVAAQHHERMDGSGYPYGLSGKHIHKFSRIVGIVDIYTELVSIRPSVQKLASYEVAEMIGAQAGNKLDKKITEIFLEGIVAYPLQSIVRLNTGEVGKVVHQNRAFPMRPVVKVDAAQIDLSKTPTVFVEDLIQLGGEDILLN